MITQAEPLSQGARIERSEVDIPQGFDADLHAETILARVHKRSGPGWKISHVADGKIHLIRHTAITAEDGGGKMIGKRLSLGREVKPADVATLVTQWENQYSEPQLRVVELSLPLGICTLEEMDERTYRCREAIAAALGYKYPWDVRIKPRKGTIPGWEFELRGAYDPTKHLPSLRKVAEETVGAFGWTVDVNPITKSGNMTYGEPASFPPAIHYPFNQRRDNPLRIPVGRALGDRPDDAPIEVAIDLAAAPHGMFGGTTGSGKSVTVNQFIYGAVSAGLELVILDVPGKKVDYMWVKPFCRPGGWGCDSLDDAVTALKIVVAEGDQRAKALESMGLVTWMDLPEPERFKGILIIIDEASALLTTEKLPAGIPKDSTEYVSALAENIRRFQLQRLISTIAAVYRFVGIHIWVSNQVSNANTGIGPTIRSNLSHRLLMGPKPSEQNRRQFFLDASLCPTVPNHIANDKGARRGVGVAELEGAAPVVFKGYWADLEAFRQHLEESGAPTCHDPAPTAEQRAYYLSLVDDQRMDDSPDSPGASSGGETYAQDRGPMCEACGHPINGITGECNCSF